MTEPVTYDNVVSICDAHGIGLPVDCIEMVVEIIRLAASPAASAQSGEPIYQTRWSHPETVWGDVQKETYDRFETFGYVERRIVYANPQPSQAEKGDEVFEADFLCVDSFAEGMKQKLLAARLKGRRGWQDCDPTELSIMLREHVEKGDPLDVANFCMFLWHLEQPIGDAALPMGRRAAAQPAQTAVVLDDGRAAFVNGLSRTQCNAIEYFVTQMRGVDSAAYVDMFDAFRDYINSLVGPVQARAASPQLVAQTAESTDSEFKNFHRLLCERFDYTHDDKDWKRDQLSLIEWIAAAPQPELTERAITDEQISLLAAEYSSVLRGSKIGDWDFAFSDYRELTKFARALLAAAQPATEDKP